MYSSLKIFAVLMVAFVALAGSVVVEFKDCGSKLGKLTVMDFDCDGGTAVPCTFTKKHTYHGNLTITPNTAINNGTIVFHAIIGPISLPFPFPDNNLCKDHHVDCPLKKNVPVVAELSLTIPTIAPAVKFVAQIEFKTSDKDDIICAEFIAKIVN